MGKKGTFPCGCPFRLAVGTVQSILGKLKAIFALYGKGQVWDAGEGKGNPVESPSVRKYVKALQLEQSRSHVSAKQATPLFIGKLRQVAFFIDDQLKESVLTPSRRFILLRDQAFFKVQFFSGDRANDLGLCLSQEVVSLPDGQGLVFTHTVGKTLGTGRVNRFLLPRVKDNVMCPVAAIRVYIEGALDMGVDLRSGYLFRTLDHSKSIVIDEPVTSSAMCDRLKKYLTNLGIYEGETPHGMRGACAITLVSSGAATGDVMDHIGWASEASYKRYSRLGKMLGKGSVANVMAGVAKGNFDYSETVYNHLTGF